MAKYVFLEHESKYDPNPNKKFYSIGRKDDKGEIDHAGFTGDTPERLRTVLSAALRDLYDEEIYRKSLTWGKVEYNVLDQFDADADAVARTVATTEATDA